MRRRSTFYSDAVGEVPAIVEPRPSLFLPFSSLLPPSHASLFSLPPLLLTGANDVANAFATSVGAKTLTLAQAVVLAIVFEFTGALVLGRTTTDVIAGKIANIKDFTGSPETYAYGMIIALAVGFFWQWWASSKGEKMGSRGFPRCW